MTTPVDKFHFPPQDLAAPSLFAADPEAVTLWLGALPKSNLGQTARAVFQAVQELNRVPLAPALRSQLLEIIRPAIHYAATGLRRHYLNQPIVLPEQSTKVARLAHVLHEQLAIGYSLAATSAETLGQQGGFGQSALATMIHRAITEHTLNLLRDYQLYRNAYPGTWRAVHMLARLARTEGCDTVVVADMQSGNCTVEAAYVRALLLGSAKSGQLRQDDLARIFQYGSGWAALTTLRADDADALLVVDPNGDDGPLYRHFAEPKPDWLGLDTAQLARHLIEQAQCAEDAAFGEQPLSVELLSHLAHNWGTAATRAFQRVDVREPVDIVLGLNTAHFLLAGEQELDALLTGEPRIEATFTLEDENPFLRTESPARRSTLPRDVWDTQVEPDERVHRIPTPNVEYQVREENLKAQEKEKEKYRRYRVERINVSAGGLCIAWPLDEPVQVRTGELVGISENGNGPWSIGVIRWLRSTPTGPLLGIELLSPTAEAFGARPVPKAGPQIDYQRALLLPEIRQTSQPATLLLPRLPFRAGQKVSLLCRDQETRVQLTRRVMSTPNFNVFEFRHLSGAPAEPEDRSIDFERSGAGSFDNLWDIL